MYVPEEGGGLGLFDPTALPSRNPGLLPAQPGEETSLFLILHCGIQDFLDSLGRDLTPFSEFLPRTEAIWGPSP